MKLGIIFDMDGTLWDSAEGVALSWTEIVQREYPQKGNVTTEEIQSVMGNTMDRIAELLFGELPENERMELLDHCCNHENDYLREHGGILYPDLTRTWKKLREKYHLYIVSNCQKGYIEAFLDHYDFWNYFDDIECYGNNELSKGENIKLLATRNRLTDAIYVGDIQGDYNSTMEAGYHFIHAAYGFGNVEADVPRINSFQELPGVADKVFERYFKNLNDNEISQIEAFAAKDCELKEYDNKEHKDKEYAYEEYGYAKLDMERGRRCGFPEVIYCSGKPDEFLKNIYLRMYEANGEVFGTRATKQQYELVKTVIPEIEYDPVSKILKFEKKDKIRSGRIAVCCAGTADIPVAEEAAQTAEYFGSKVDRIYDVGVSGIHRLLSKADEIRKANCVVAVAGMEGALASVIGGLVQNPVIAVPTSVGYGASMGGISALLTMINSCANGIAVVNIDNGYGAGYMATQINRLAVNGNKEIN